MASRRKGSAVALPDSVSAAEMRAFLDDRGLTQAEAARLVGVSLRTMNGVVAGERPSGALGRFLRLLVERPDVLPTLASIGATEAR